MDITLKGAAKRINNLDIPHIGAEIHVGEEGCTPSGCRCRRFRLRRQGTADDHVREATVKLLVAWKVDDDLGAHR